MLTIIYEARAKHERSPEKHLALTLSIFQKNYSIMEQKETQKKE